MMPDYRNMLFIKPSSLGDIVHAMPAFTALRRAYPMATLTWLVKQQWSELVERIEGIDRVWPVPSGMKGWLSQLSALRKERFDAVIDLQGLFRSAATGWLTGAPQRTGFATAREGSPWFYTHPVPVPSADMHAVDRYLLAAQKMGAIVTEKPEFSFRIRQSDREQVDRLLREAGLAPRAHWVAINVSARWPTKRWPIASFAAAADRIQKEGSAVVFIGGSDERGDVTAVKALMKTPAVDLAGRTTVGLLPALLTEAALFLTNDSGPMHVAAAVGTPVVALFGPTSPVRTGPYGANHRVLSGQVPCSPCFSRSCRNPVYLECLKQISVEQVTTVVREQLMSRLASR